MLAQFPRFRYPFEFAFLLALAFCLPLFEAPKNVFCVLYLVTWLFNRVRSRDWGGRWDNWDTLFSVWLASPYIIALFAGIQHTQWNVGTDVLRLVSVAWLLKRSSYGETEWLALLRMLGASTLIAVLWALWDWALPHTYEGIQLHSVGHVNHSTIYLVIVLTALIAGMCSFWGRLRTTEKLIAVTLIVVSTAAILLSGSRAAAGMIVLLALMLGLIWLRRSRWPLFWIALGIALFGVSVYLFGDDLKHKQAIALAGEDSVLNGRQPIWNRAWVAWRQYPMFGVGIDNFKLVSDENVKRWVEAEGKPYDPLSYRGSSHAHSVFLTTLVERGVFGLGVLLALLAAWLFSLARALPHKQDPPIHWLLWCGAAGALVTIVAVGFVNTTLHHEHGILSMLLLGMWLGHRNRHADGSLR